MSSPANAVKPYVGCAADRGGCGCMGFLDCVHDNKLERATGAIYALRETHPHLDTQGLDEADCRLIAALALTVAFHPREYPVTNDRRAG